MQGGTGAQGEVGATGPKGDKGDQGDTGSQGIQGIQGNQGPQGPYDVHVYQNASSAPSAPTGGSVNVALGTITAPSGWSTTISTPAAGQKTYATRDTINPSSDSGDVTPLWGTPYEVGGTGPAGATGPAGSDGSQGDQGLYRVHVYRNATAKPSAPTGGSVVVSTGVVTAPSNWSTSISAPASGENTWAALATVNPASQSGTITPTWSVVYEIGGIGATGPKGDQGDAGAAGSDGSDGTDGAAGIYFAEIYRNASSAPSTPTGGSIVVSTGVVTAPTDWTTTPGSPSAGESIYASRVTITPASQSGTITPTWGSPYQVGGVGPTGPQGNAGAAGAAGSDGSDGSQGPQGIYTVHIYRNAASAPSTPTGGSVAVSTGVVTAPTNWSATLSTPPSGQNAYAARATINPSTQSGSVTPTWSAVYETGGVGPTGPKGDRGDTGSAGSDGSDGTDGSDGSQGIYWVFIYRNASSAPSTPTGGSVVVSSGSVTAPTDWGINPTSPAAGEAIYATWASVNPASDSGTITPTWGTPYQLGGVGPTGPQGDRGDAGSDGSDGSDGSQGDQGVYYVEIYQNAASTPSTPSGGSVTVSSAAVTAPTNWTTSISSPAAGQETYAARARINPASQSGSVTPTWSTPYVVGGRGATGQAGSQGPQGPYDIHVYRNASSAPSTPTGGSVVVSTGAVTAPTDWSTSISSPGAGEDSYAVRYRVNPATQSGTVTPTWSAVFEVGGTGPAGPAGQAGSQGSAGRYFIEIYQNASSAPTTPTGGSLVVSTGVVTAPSGWSTTPSTPAAGQAIFAARDSINPASDSGTITPTWGSPYQLGGVGPTGPTGETGATGGGSGVPTAPSGGSQAVRYELQIAADGTATWVATGSGGGGAGAGSHTRYGGYSTDSTFTADEFTTSSTTDVVTLPTFSADGWIAFAIPSTAADLTGITEVGSPFNQIGAFTKASGTLTIGGTAHKYWVSNTIVYHGPSSGTKWTLT